MPRVPRIAIFIGCRLESRRPGARVPRRPTRTRAARRRPRVGQLGSRSAGSAGQLGHARAASAPRVARVDVARGVAAHLADAGRRRGDHRRPSAHRLERGQPKPSYSEGCTSATAPAYSSASRSGVGPRLAARRRRAGRRAAIAPGQHQLERRGRRRCAVAARRPSSSGGQVLARLVVADVQEVRARLAGAATGGSSWPGPWRATTIRSARHAPQLAHVARPSSADADHRAGAPRGGAVGERA